jgi:alpha-glucosidase
MKIRTALLLAVMPFAAFSQQTNSYHVKSPDGKIDVSILTGPSVTWSVKHQATDVITPSAISLSLNNGEVLGKNAKVKSAKTTSVDAYFNTPIYKKDKVHDHYNQLSLNFKGDYALVFRAYDDGVTYRFVTQKKGGSIINNEQAEFNFKDNSKAYLPFVNDYRNKDKYNTSFEAHYNQVKLTGIQKDTLAFLPVLVELGDNKKAVITDADIEDYPGMYLTGTTGQAGLHAVFANVPLKELAGGFNSMNYVVDGRADYIAKTAGSRALPWRAIVISTEDKQLADNDMVQKLAAASRVEDLSWIKPGKVAWDWWNDWNISGVNFKAGVNVPTYKYYIDFASANKLEYIVIDEGWSSDIDLNKISPDINIKELVEYGKQKNVGIILWASWYATLQQTDAVFEKYAQMGIKGFKIDFIDRDDQLAVKSLYTIAQKAAAHHLVVDYHGMYKPAGLQRTFPNILNLKG